MTKITAMITGAAEIQEASFCWKDSVSVHKLLDVISGILAEEYCKTAREHTELFTKKG